MKRLLMALVGVLVSASPAFAMTQSAFQMETNGWASFNEVTTISFNHDWWSGDFDIGQSRSSVANDGSMDLRTSFIADDNMLSQVSVLDAEGETMLGEKVSWASVWMHPTRANSFIGFMASDNDGTVVEEMMETMGEDEGTILYNLATSDDLLYIHSLGIGRPDVPALDCEPMEPVSWSFPSL